MSTINIKVSEYIKMTADVTGNPEDTRIAIVAITTSKKAKMNEASGNITRQDIQRPITLPIIYFPPRPYAEHVSYAD